MVTFSFNKDKGTELKILCLGAHSDDIEIGCGGTLFRLLAEYPNLHFNWVVFGSSNPVRAEEALHSAEDLLAGASAKKIIVKGFRDGFFPYIGYEIKEYFEVLKKEVSPDIIFTHYRNDLHQDHRLISELTWNTFRDSSILEYEIPKYDGDLGTPNLFFHLNHEQCQTKVDHIQKYFKTQMDRFWFTEDTFWALARLRGVESRAPESYAEAFYCRKMTL